MNVLSVQDLNLDTFSHLLFVPVTFFFFPPFPLAALPLNSPTEYEERGDIITDQIAPLLFFEAIRTAWKSLHFSFFPSLFSHNIPFLSFSFPTPTTFRAVVASAKNRIPKSCRRRNGFLFCIIIIVVARKNSFGPITIRTVTYVICI